MTELRRCALALVVALLAGLAIAAPARAACRSDSGGIGGTGHAPSGKRGAKDRGGIGGTGRSEPGGVGGTGHRDEGGVGGTGRKAEGGVGGTGIVGVITGFGSVCVNGLEVEYDASTPVDADGAPSGSDSLAVGQVVVIDAAAHGGLLHAERIGVRNAVVGPVESIDPVRRELDVLGQHVKLDPATQLAGAGGRPFAPSDIKAGDFVAVSGLRGADGSVVATRVEPVAPRELVSVTGPLAAVAPSRAAIGALTVEVPPSHQAPELGSRMALVVGRLDPASGALRAERVTPAVSFANAPERVSIEGLVQAPTARGFRTEHADVDTTGLAAGAANATIGARVVVTGAPEAGGRVRAERVEVLLPDRSSIGTPPAVVREHAGSSHEASEDHGVEVEDGEHAGKPEIEHEGSETSEGIEPPEHVEKPETPAVEEHPTTPEHVERPETPEVEKPEAPAVPAVEKPEAPEVPAVEKPEKPEVPVVEKPEKPEVPGGERPTTPEVPQIERPATPEVPQIEKPETPEVPKVERPEKPEVVRPETPEPRERPETPERGH